MNCLVTGAPGFAGSHLAGQLVSKGARVTALAAPGENLSRLDRIAAQINIRHADITDADAVIKALGQERFDVVYHLAAVASVAGSFSRPLDAYRVNTLGTANVLDALRQRAPDRFIYISSADVYGHVPQDMLPVRENTRLAPVSPYSASKVAAEVVCSQFWRTYGFPVVIIRPFNHTGPGQGAGFAPGDFASAIARIEKGLAPPKIMVGNLDSSRDYTDVRDMVEAYTLAARYCEPGEVYNISSGRAVRIGALLDMLLSLSTTKIEVVADPGRQRPSDMPLVVGDHSKFTRRTLWKPEIPFERTLTDLLEWHRTAPENPA